jgi:pimeloyl-ACP methyl ester carboxylesterase
MTMERAGVNGVELEYEVRGSGEPIVLLHGGLLADENTPLAHEATLTDRYKVINFHRRGFAGSTKLGKPAWIEDQVADTRALLDSLEVDKAHVVGHSLGGVIAIQLALDNPERVQSLALMEPALMGAIAKAEAANNPKAAESQKAFMAGMDNVNELARQGDKRAALEAFLETRAAGAFRGVLDFLTQSGEFEQAVRDADTFLNIEMPAAYRWNFTPEIAAGLKPPVLSILGSHSPERARGVQEVLEKWVPQTQEAILPNAEHALPLMDPPGIARVIVEWCSRYPIAAGATPGAAL